MHAKRANWTGALALALTLAGPLVAQETNGPWVVARTVDLVGATGFLVLTPAAFAQAEERTELERRHMRAAIEDARKRWRSKYDDRKDKQSSTQSGGSTLTVSTSTSFPRVSITPPEIRKVAVEATLEAAEAARKGAGEKHAAAAERRLTGYSFAESGGGPQRATEAQDMIRESLDRLVRSAQRDRERQGGKMLNTASGTKSFGAGASGSGLGLRGGGTKKLGE